MGGLHGGGHTGPHMGGGQGIGPQLGGGQGIGPRAGLTFEIRDGIPPRMGGG